MSYYVTVAGRQYLAALQGGEQAQSVSIREVGSSVVHTLAIDAVSGTSVVVGGKVVNLASSSDVNDAPEQSRKRLTVRLGLQPTTVELFVETEHSRKTGLALNSGAAKAGRLTSPMPGRVLEVFVRVGQRVSKGSALLVVEAMKMENQIVAERDGVIAAVHVQAGATVETHAALIDFGPSS